MQTRSRGLLALCDDALLPVHPTARDPRTGEHIRALGVLASGRVVWPIAGGDGTDDDDDAAAKAAAEKKAADEAAAAAEKRFSQDDLNREAGKRAAEAKRAAIKEVAESLGMTVDEAKKFIEDKRAADEAAKSDEQKRLDEIAERERKAEERDRSAAERERHASIREALAEAGATGQELKDAAVLISAGLAADAEDEAIATAVEDLKKRRGELFKGTTGGSTGTHTSTGTGGNGGGSGGGGADTGKSAERLKAGEEAARKFGLVKGEKQTA